MKKSYINLLYLCLCCLFLSLYLCACGNSAASEKAPEESSYTSNTQSTVSSKKYSNDITIDQIDYSVEEGIYNGARDIFMQCANNSPYSISGLEISFIQKPDVTEEQLENYYTDLQEKYELSDDDIASLKEQKISMHAETEKLIPSGEVNNYIHLYYYSGNYYMNNLAHYDLVEPDIATIKYVKDGKICTEYYDYRSEKYSVSEDTEAAFSWGKISPLAELVTKPDVEVCKVEFDRDDVFWFYAFGCSLDDYNAYVESCKSNGFTIDISDYGDSYYANDKNGNRIAINYSKEDGSISVDIDAAKENKGSGNASDITSQAQNSNNRIKASDNNIEEHGNTGSVFEPQDVSDSTIESIQTYGDYLTMYRIIISDYLADYENALKGTVLYDEDSFREMKKDMDDEFAEEEKEYGKMKDQKILGKDAIVNYLKSYRDTLQSMVDSYSEIAKTLQ